MKAWLPPLIEALEQNPILALSSARNLARAAVFGPDGALLAGALGSPALTAQAADEARLLRPGECRILSQPTQLTLERLPADENTRRFWLSARDNQAGAWASWLLTMPSLGPEGLKLARHLLSAFGPWTNPRLPEELRDQWSLLPLKAGLGRLFVLGDDALALEVTLLAARTGLTVTWLTALDQKGPELDEARLLADFDLERLSGWPALTVGRLRELGLADGVRLVVTTAEHDSFLPAAGAEIKLAYLALSGEAETGPEAARGLFPKPLTTAQKALGLVAEMLK
ncbi:hypothetical protein FACS189460_4920 [Deltaproteobacteria bacterium]|nr:hypothetical protein FACS189460_4920 [Deltaproteobacteria bacterium]